MSERFQKWGLVVVGLLVIVGGVWWYFAKGRGVAEQWRKLTPSGKQKEEIFKLQPSDREIPISKIVYENETAVIYKLVVRLAEPWWRQERGDYRLLRGGATLINDPLGRIIQIQLGALDGSVYVGEFLDGWGGSGVYEVRQQSELEEKVGLGDELKLEIKLASTETKEGLSQAEMITQVLDGLIDEYRKGEYELSIPNGFMLSTNKVGVKSL